MWCVASSLRRSDTTARTQTKSGKMERTDGRTRHLFASLVWLSPLSCLASLALAWRNREEIGSVLWRRFRVSLLGKEGRGGGGRTRAPQHNCLLSSFAGKNGSSFADEAAKNTPCCCRGRVTATELRIDDVRSFDSSYQHSHSRG